MSGFKSDRDVLSLWIDVNKEIKLKELNNVKHLFSVTKEAYNFIPVFSKLCENIASKLLSKMTEHQNINPIKMLQ